MKYIAKSPAKVYGRFSLVLVTVLTFVLFLILDYFLIPRLPYNIKSLFAAASISQKTTVVTKSLSADQKVFDEINPEKGYKINVSYGNLGPQMIAAGVVDLDKFKNTYQQNGQPLTQEELNILTKGSDNKIIFTRENSYFLLNFFWAVGLANKSSILTDGDMVKYGQGKLGNFASTGGWTLAKGNPMDYYSQSNLIPLTTDQEALVQKISSNIYRPCCNNPTSFPDCNHGMALLGVLQLMAGNGATENQMYDAAKYINAYWFPSNYYDLALYFQNKEGKLFKDVPGQVILSKDYSSASGWQAVKQWLTDKGIEEKPPTGGGGCGV